MIWLIGLALLITAVTVWYMARPLARSVTQDDRERRGQLQQLRDRLLAQMSELDVEEADRNIDTAVVSDERSRLEAELAQALRELETLGKAPKKKKSKKKQPESRRAWAVALVVMGIVFPLAASGLYALHQRATLALLWNPQATAAANASVPPMVLEMVARLEQRLEEHPDDLAGWMRLGRAYAVLGRQEAAQAAYARAYKLAPDDPQAIAEYAGFLYTADPQNTRGLVYKLYSRLHKLDPGNQDALWFLGLAAYHKGEYKEALGLWGKLAKALPPQSNEASHLRMIMDKTREKLGGK